MPRLTHWLLVACLLVAGATACVPVAAHAAVPRSFFGVMADGPLLGGTVDVPAETGKMAASGVGSIRLAVYWNQAQPYADDASVPADQAARYTDAGGVPTDFSATDAVVGAAAEHGISVLPVVLGTPAWASADGSSFNAAPADPETYTRYLTALVARYGPGGSFWAAHPELHAQPIRRWQVWNEPDITKYWDATPWPSTYVALLRAAHAALKAADPGAQVVMGGLTNKSWLDLGQLYDAGARGLFDIAATHPFSRRVANVLKIVRLDRQTMRVRGDRRLPLLLSEISWSSGKGHSTFNYGWETSEEGQAQRIRQVLPQLAAVRTTDHVLGVYWYTWLSPAIGSAESFDYGGLERLTASGSVTPKPALAAFSSEARRLER